MRNSPRPAPLALSLAALFAALAALFAAQLSASAACAVATPDGGACPATQDGPRVAQSAASPAAPAAPSPYTVEFPFFVVDDAGRTVADVRREDVSVTDNGAAQTVAELSRDAKPVSYGLVIDNSGSMRTILDLLVRTGGTLVGANRPTDEAFVMRFVDVAHTETLEDFTTSRQELADALSGMYVEGGQTAIIDAVYTAAQHVAQRNEDGAHRRALVLITDGEDRGSRHKPEELFELLRRERVEVFVIGLTSLLDNVGGFVSKSPRARAASLLESVAEESGGRAFFPGSNRRRGDELGDAVKEIIAGLQSPYSVSYKLPPEAADGKFHKVQIKVAGGKEKRKVIAAPGYYAPSGPAKPADK